MSQNSANFPQESLDRHRIRPQANRKIPAILGGIILIFALGLGAGYFLWGKPLSQARSDLASAQAELDEVKAQSQAVEEAASAAATAEPADDGGVKQVTRYPITEDDDPSFGPASAPITIIEFSDYQCPYCQRWHEQVWVKLLETFPDQIRLVYRDFPLYSIHPEAGPAAAAANCAAEQDRYWEFHELLFTGGMDLGKEAYLKYGGDIGLNLTSFEQCLTENRYEAEVTADYEYAVGLGIQSTPTFFINGIALVGAQPFEVFKEIIELELAGKLSR